MSRWHQIIPAQREWVRWLNFLAPINFGLSPIKTNAFNPTGTTLHTKWMIFMNNQKRRTLLLLFALAMGTSRIGIESGIKYSNRDLLYCFTALLLCRIDIELVLNLESSIAIGACFIMSPFCDVFINCFN